MAIPVDTPTVTDATLKSFTGVSGDHMQVLGQIPYNLVPVAGTLANTSVTVGSTAVILNDWKPTGAVIAEIVVEGANIRYWDDGKTPTTTQGKLLLAGTVVTVEPTDFRMIAVSGTAIVQISWYAYETVEGGTGEPPVGAYYWLDFESSIFPPVDWNISRENVGGTPGTYPFATVQRLTDPLGIEGFTCRCDTRYDSGLTTDYASNTKQLSSLWTQAATAHSGYNQLNEDTWYRIKFMAPTGQNVFSNGQTNFLIEWHTDDNTQGQGGNSTGLLNYGSFPLTSGGTTTPGLVLRVATGTPSAATYTCFPGTTPTTAAGPPADAASIQHETNLQTARDNMGTFQPNNWEDHVYRILWSKTAATGKLQWWRNGTLLTDITTATLYTNPSLPNSQSYNTFGVYSYRYNVTGDTGIYYALIAIGPTAASVGFPA